MSRRQVLCFGNELHGDDGFGCHVYRQLQQKSWTQEVAVINAGIAGLDALRFVEQCTQLILVDALALDGPEGQIYVLRPEHFQTLTTDLSSHSVGIAYLLQAMEAISIMPPEINIVGVKAKTLRGFNPSLSPSVALAVPQTVQIISQLLNS